MGRLAEAISMRTIHEAEYIITHLETSHESAGDYIVTPLHTDEASYNLNINLKLVPRPAAMTVMTPLLSCRLMHTFRPPNKYVTYRVVLLTVKNG